LFQSTPRESEWRSWAWVALWSLAIFALIPLARTIEGRVRAGFGPAAFGWLVIAVVCVAAALACVAVARRAPARSRDGSLVWLIGIAALFVLSTTRLWSRPEEAMHFVQYGGLAPLLHRALSHRIHDSSIYLVGALAGTLVGCIDEAIQWVTPLRYFGLRDLGLNAYSSALVQLAIAKGIAPGYLAPAFSPAGLRLAVRTGALVWATLLLFTLNTPQRVETYAVDIAGLGFLASNPSSMMEYGHLQGEADPGVFRSRLEPDELEQLDRSRGGEAGSIVAGWEGGYLAFLNAYPAHTDPLIHEFTVHLFRRDSHAVQHANSVDGDERSWHALVVLREDRILSEHFPHTFAAAGRLLAPHRRAELEVDAPAEADYESPVSSDLVVHWTERQLLAAFGVIGIVLIAVDRRLTARARTS